tara:strand:+ start:606 stop:1034 length:429 start_codon:yes stop_codon:yes gene_type:complete
MITENLSLKGRVIVRLNDEIIQEVDNLVVTTGKNYVASRMKDATATAMSHMAVGGSNTAAAAGQTALVSESARVALTSTTLSNNDVVYVGTFGAGTGTGTLNEAGILNASSGGTMLCRVVFSGAISKGSSDSMTITWTVTAS